MPAVCNSMLPRSLSLGYHAYICILSTVYSNLYHIFFFTYNWSHKLELLYTFMFSIFLFGIFNDLFRLTLIIVFVMLKLHDFLSLLKKISLFKNKIWTLRFLYSVTNNIYYGWWRYDFILLQLFSLGCNITTIHHSSTKLTTCRI